MYKNIMLIACALLLPVQALAATPKDRDVRFTVHNFSYNPIAGADAEAGITDDYRNYSANNPGADQVCIFCHTAHNASPSVPLWNKGPGSGAYAQPAAASYRLYTSSSSLTSITKRSVLTAGSDSMLCLSCHDGKTAINVLHNSKAYDALDGNGDFIIDMNGASTPFAFGDIGGITYLSNVGATRNPDGTILDSKAGTNLTDDHPIGFSYTEAQALKPTALHDLTTASAKTAGFGVRFFGPTNRLECGSCHDPHMYYGTGKLGGERPLLPYPATAAQLARTPFLVRDNNGSGLCLACHIK